MPGPYYDLKGSVIRGPVRLSSKAEIDAVYVDGPRTTLDLVVTEIGDMQKVQTIHGKKDVVSITLTGSDPTTPVLAEAWGSHCGTFLKVCGLGSAFRVSFVPKAQNQNMFQLDNGWLVRLNTEVKICDLPGIGGESQGKKVAPVKLGASKKRNGGSSSSKNVPKKVRRASGETTQKSGEKQPVEKDCEYVEAKLDGTKNGDSNVVGNESVGDNQMSQVFRNLDESSGEIEADGEELEDEEDYEDDEIDFDEDQ